MRDSRSCVDHVRGGVRRTRGSISSPDYLFNEARMREAARETPDTLRDASSVMWAGARDIIQNTNQLFGTPYAGWTIRGESKGYDPIFRELVQQKAKDLGISTSELEKRLATGQGGPRGGNLLGLALGSPAIGELLRRQQAAQENPSGL